MASPDHGSYSPYALIPRVLTILVNEGLSPVVTGHGIKQAAESAAALLEAVGITADWPDGEQS